MEENKEYKSLKTFVSHLEQQLNSLESIPRQDFSLARREIEEHFERAIHALEARQHILLQQLDQISSRQELGVQKTKEKLGEVIQSCNGLLKAGRGLYANSKTAAERIWQGSQDLVVPNVNMDEMQVTISVKLPKDIEEIIDKHGAVTEQQKAKRNSAAQSQSNLTLRKAPRNFSKAASIATIAGNILGGNRDGKGKNASFYFPRGICWNPHDDCFYVCDHCNHAIRKVTLNGDVTTFAKVEHPKDIVLNHRTHCFFVSSCLHQIFKVNSSGISSVYAGSDNPGFSDDVGAKALFNMPSGLAIDQKSGTIFVCDYGNNAIRIITAHEKVLTLAGESGGPRKGAKLNGPSGIFFDEADANLLICDTENNKIKRISKKGEVSTLCECEKPTSVVKTASGVILVTSYTTEQIYKILEIGGKYEVQVLLAENAQSQDRFASFSGPTGIQVHELSHSCFICDRNSHTIKQISFS